MERANATARPRCQPTIPFRASTSSSLSPFEIGSNRKQSSRANCGIRAPVRARLQPTNSKRAVRFVRPCKGREIKTEFSPRALTPVGDSTPRPVTARCADVDHYNASQNRLTSGRRRSFTIRVTIKYIDERISGTVRRGTRRTGYSSLLLPARARFFSSSSSSSVLRSVSCRADNRVSDYRLPFLRRCSKG